ncbi:unnamed protein product (macronuclear) [Paramecium tetraurelia]|uniref:Uncharacterized protein n=1 Tax=Paramecium tetraurelia TaxID=5888 RepID=A0BF21_PARTE|nr:uncharacterized protein GSPATT00028173001 [Paramecium tetraurelia]CAK57138.1 unnamed protein product [Paramecium tetraurelia]|eukprot:XP_001424536.1 hypothetical protein (macronuclear) [Paramecium tetraurelia strain d4-2]
MQVTKRSIELQIYANLLDFTIEQQKVVQNTQSKCLNGFILKNYISMINNSKVNSLVFIKQRKPQCSSLKKRYKERERAWNDRIIISEQILHLRTKESFNRKRLPKLQNTTASIVEKYINIHKHQQEYVELVECEQRIFETKLEQLKQLYKVYCIPQVHQNLFNALLEASSNKRAVVEEELNLMNQKLAPIQHCMFVIAARENCFKQVLTLVKQNQNQIDQISEKLKDLRMLNITTLESIVKWQQYFQNKNLRQVFQLDENPPYHERFQNDYLELKPQLTNLFKVSDQADPFFVQLLGKGQQRLYIRIRRAEAELMNLNYNNIYIK